MTRTSIVAIGAATLLSLTACSSSAGGKSSPGATSPSTQQSAAAPAASNSSPKITIKGYGYSGSLTVKAGATVTVVNDDSVAHTLTDKQTNKFDTGNINASGGTGTFTAPTKAGKYPFGCTYHPEMAGTLVVTA